jgi:hypothetical protein
MNHSGLFELFTFVRLFFTFTLPVVLCTTLRLYKHCMFSLSPAWDATTYHRPTHHPALSLVLLEYLLQFCLTTL